MSLTGTLEALNFTTVLDLCQHSGRTGILTLTTGDDTALVYLAAGQVIDAALLLRRSRVLNATGDAALIQLFRWQNGNFSFRNAPEVAGRKRQISRSIAELRAAAEAQLTTAWGIAPDTALLLSTDQPDTERVKLSIDQWQVMSQMVNTRTFAELCSAIGTMTQPRISAVVESLVRAGLVQINTQRPSQERSVGMLQA
jgi:Domain of unknown function (DUF4388)